MHSNTIYILFRLGSSEITRWNTHLYSKLGATQLIKLSKELEEFNGKLNTVSAMQLLQQIWLCILSCQAYIGQLILLVVLIQSTLGK